MRKPLTIIVAGLLICFTARAQHIPDKHFADAIRKTCSDCIDSNNNLLPAAKDLSKLDVSSYDIESLEGVEGFSSLTELDCDHNERLTSLNKLPATLIELRCYVTGINNIVSLPPNLKTLICRVTPIASLPALPATLEELDCQETGLTSLPPLPASLIFLYANNSPIKNLPKLPGKLRFLYIANTKITSLPDLPAGLASLVISDNVFDCIPYNNNPDLSIKDVDLNPSKTTFCKGNQKTNVIAEKKPEQDNGKCISGNCKNGIGVYVTKDGGVITSTYKGSFKDGKFDGKGTFTSTVGSYTGDFKNDLMEGNGTLVFKNGKKQTGIFKEGKLWSGTGYFEYGEKESYNGGVKENMPDGQGVLNYPNGKNFTGSFSKGNAANGKGYIKLDKSSYEGTLVNGKFSGMGIYTNPYGQIFSGNFVDGDLNGNGKMIGTDGEQYDGNFKKTLPDGYGILKLKDGRVYKGNWADGKQNGNGSSYDANGKLVYSGEWSNGKKTNSEKSVSTEKSHLDDGKETFSRVTFKGWRKEKDWKEDEEYLYKVNFEFHYISYDNSFYGTEEIVMHLGGSFDKDYKKKINITGTYDPVTFKIHIVDGSLLSNDLSADLSWPEDRISDGEVYDAASHPGYHVIKGKTTGGDEFQITDYY